jgi:hypothetical protein
MIDAAAAYAEDELDRMAEMHIRSRADRSVAVLEKAFIRNGSGRYFVLRSPAAAITRMSVTDILLGDEYD